MEIIEEKPISIFEVKDEMVEMKKRDKELNFRAKKVEEYSNNIVKLKSILSIGNLDSFVNIVEDEAMMLHALMMTSDPSYILIKPNTLKIINSIKSFRNSAKIPVCFTLDAGANVHLLYPNNAKDQVELFIENELKKYCKNDSYILDNVGEGPVQL